MIDIENVVINEVITQAKAHYDPIYVYGEAQKQPAGYPAIIIREMSNTVKERTISSGGIENYVDVMYQVSVYSNLKTKKKQQAKELRNFVDEIMKGMGFVRTFSQPIENLSDTSISRYESRYEATTDGQHQYRR